ncbi:MAG: hypothetical protein J6K04_07080 [Lachnospiraceae bacterium]|nr:hypothetical protein [Lachnospiraceae bacterium]
MGLRRKQRKNLHEIGIKEYQFIFDKEKEIYKYLSCHEVKEKEKLGEQKLLFDCYRDWKKYVVDKCKEWDFDKRNEFCRYLNQMIRNREHAMKYTQVVLPIILTELLSIMLVQLLKLLDIEWSQLHWIFSIAVVVLVILIVLIIVYPVVDFFNILYEDSIEKHLLLDYKEIVEELLCETQKTGKENLVAQGFNCEESALLLVEKEKIEIRNVLADVDIELPEISIKIKQKDM